MMKMHDFRSELINLGQRMMNAITDLAQANGQPFALIFPDLALEDNSGVDNPNSIIDFEDEAFFFNDEDAVQYVSEQGLHDYQFNLIDEGELSLDQLEIVYTTIGYLLENRKVNA